MTPCAFATAHLSHAHKERAPDGSLIRPLIRTKRGSMAHFELKPGSVTQAVRHRQIDELWYIVSGRGELWRSNGQAQSIVTLEPETAVTIVAQTAFQFRNTGPASLTIVGVTMPPWPGDTEAEFCAGHWPSEA